MKAARPMLSLATGEAVVLPSTTADAEATRMTDGKLVDASGMTLDTFDTDVAGGGSSTCDTPCATPWPASMMSADAQAIGDDALVTRGDGRRQRACRGKPVYLCSADRRTGDATGDPKDVWHVVR